MEQKDKFKKLCNSRQLTFISNLKEYKDLIPDDWFLSDYEIEDKISALRKEIYKLQNSRKNQPKLVVIEGKDKIDRVRVFQGFKIVDLDKRLLVADNWYEIKTQEQATEIYNQFELGEDLKKYLDSLEK